ncbi:HAD family hydrolase [Salibacterium qingdaonense]|uniref:Phosphoglycolate phosphatase, HAD superfamily n=1 Tax=Salibacterium qingdaonense TaxID=266892 RepID=A0A1I4PN72_9BACI|nr:HAD hydrolase-like protein [Salibacterium qingdaonense]SFM29199.1 Phosphoglycolate phosphatase, HAD superfamily [Salibacterium qingdaonense]
MRDVLIFDMDGTLFDSRQLLNQAIDNTLQYAVEQDLHEHKGWTEADRVAVIGLPFYDAFQWLLPEASAETLEMLEPVLDRFILHEMDNGEGSLYEGVPGTLQQLKDEGYRLYVASNGNAEYVPSAIEREGLTDLFEGIYSVQQYQAVSKVNLVRLILDDAGRDAVMIGDRASDIEAGKENGLPVIGCRFGFGSEEEVSIADELVDEFSGIPALLKEKQL